MAPFKQEMPSQAGSATPGRGAQGAGAMGAGVAGAGWGEAYASPQLLGRYRIIEQRDQGGFGSVLVCWDVRLQRRVAIKCLPLESQDPAAFAQAGYDAAGYGGAGYGASYGAGAGAWGASGSVGYGPDAAVAEALAEARASSALTHPNIVTVHDFAVDDQFAYIVMEYVDGVTLAELMGRVEGGVLIWCEVAYVLQSVASALSYAHDHGVLHLDIKPANIMIDKTGAVKLADFGMASLASAAGWEDARGGTVGYMPPEQLTGELVDERTDVFSLATVCYQALTGRAPFSAPTAEKSLKLEQKGAAPLDSVEAELAGPVTLAFESAMSADPAGRMVDPLELADEVVPSLGDPEEGRASICGLLDQAEEGEEFDESAWRALDPPGRRIPWLADFVCVAADALAAFLVASWACQNLGLPLSWASILAPAACAALTALAPMVGACATLLVACVATGSAAFGSGGLLPALGWSIAVAVPTLLWVVRVLPWLPRNSSRLACVSLLAGPATGSPVAAVGVAGYGLPPKVAALTSALSSLLALVVRTGMGGGLGGRLFSAAGAAAGTAGAGAAEAAGSVASSASAANPLAAVGAAAAVVGFSALAAAVASWCTGKGGSGHAAAGQLLAMILMLAGLCVASGLENGQIWAAPSVQATAVAVGSGVLMLLMVALFGPATARREGEDSELP